jgi:type II secretory pathway component PulK
VWVAFVPSSTSPPIWVAAICIVLWCLMLIGIIVQGFLFRHERLSRKIKAEAIRSERPWE